MPTTANSNITYFKDFFEAHPNIPDLIKNHKIFDSVKSVNKIFPYYGLSNFRKNISIDLGEKVNKVALADRTLMECKSWYLKNKHPLAKAFAKIISNKIKRSPFIINENNKVSIKLPYEFKYDDKSYGKPGESIFKVLNKINADIDPELKIENTDWFKNYSLNNSGRSRAVVVFSSSGINGLWDISTISMRGIKSCQTWGSGYSKCLTGSLLNQNTGVIYLEGNTKIDDLGYKMNYRCIVRFLVHKNDKSKKIIYLDKMYPNENKTVLKSFINELKLRVDEKNIQIKSFDDTHSNESIRNDYRYPYCKNTNALIMNENIKLNNIENNLYAYVSRGGSHTYEDHAFQIKNSVVIDVKSNIDELIRNIISNYRSYYNIFYTGIKVSSFYDSNYYMEYLIRDMIYYINTYITNTLKSEYISIHSFIRNILNKETTKDLANKLFNIIKYDGNYNRLFNIYNVNEINNIVDNLVSNCKKYIIILTKDFLKKTNFTK